MKQKILLFLSSIIGHLTIISEVSTILVVLDKQQTIWDFIMIGITVVLLIIDGILGIKQGTVVETVVADNLGSKDLKLTKSNNPKSLVLEEKFFNDVMEYCQSIGLNPSVSTETGVAMIVDIKGDKIREVMPLSLPDGESLTEKNYNMQLAFIKEQIDTAKVNLDNKINSEEK